MSQSNTQSGQPDGHDALALLRQALEILDAIAAPANIGAHVDLAICQLRDMLEADPPTPRRPALKKPTAMNS